MQKGVYLVACCKYNYWIVNSNTEKSMRLSILLICQLIGSNLVFANKKSDSAWSKCDNKLGNVTSLISWWIPNSKYAYKFYSKVHFEGGSQDFLVKKYVYEDDFQKGDWCRRLNVLDDNPDLLKAFNNEHFEWKLGCCDVIDPVIDGEKGILTFKMEIPRDPIYKCSTPLKADKNVKVDCSYHGKVDRSK